MKNPYKNNLRRKSLFAIISIILLAISCITPFEPDYKGEGNFIVVDGSLIKGEETQIIKISRASYISNPIYVGVKNCNVKILDENGNEFIFTEGAEGEYTAKIDDELLTFNTRYKLVFSTPSGSTYESDYQQLLETAPVDSFYCIKENQYSGELSSESILGLQFYVDIKAPENASKFYKWKIEETYEVHANQKIYGVYDGNKVTVSDWPTDSLYYCWKNRIPKGLFTYSISNQSNNVVKKIPLNFKINTSQDLTIKYCATLKQYALNKNAYDYWHQKEVELKESGEIYTSQPAQIKSNVYNINNYDERVMGFFWVSSYTIKRLFLKDPFLIGYNHPGDCKTAGLPAIYPLGPPIENALLNLIKRTRNIHAPPVYIYYLTTMSGGMYFVALSDDCINCRLLQGSTQKPDYWGENGLD